MVFIKEEKIMAKENVKKFYDEISKNKELQEKFVAAQKGYETEGKNNDEIFEDIVLPIAGEAGYEFTMSEYREAQRDAIIERGISEEELENVSGGGFCLLLGFGVMSAGGCLGDGIEATPTSDNFIKGVGATACAYIGIGVGATWD